MWREGVTTEGEGGEVKGKRKPPEKWKAGEKTMRKLGEVEIPQEAFIAALKIDG